MANYYSDHFSSQVSPTVKELSHSIGPAGLVSDAGGSELPSAAYARSRTLVAQFTIPSIDAGVAPLIGDTVRLGTFKSSDRVLEISASTPVGGTTGTGAMHLGWYRSGFDSDGTEVDDELYASSKAVAAGLIEFDMFTHSGTLSDEDRGKPIWAQAFIGNGTDTEDPKENWDLVATFSGTVSPTNAAAVSFRVEYTSGG